MTKLQMFLFTFILIFTTADNVFAKTQVYESDESTTENSTIPSPRPKNSDCKDITGAVIKPGQSGYETCLNKVPAKKSDTSIYESADGQED